MSKLHIPNRDSALRSAAKCLPLAVIYLLSFLGKPAISEESIADCFAGSPPQSLIGQLESPASPVQALAEGQLRRSFSRVAPGVLMVRGEIESIDKAADIPEVPLVDLSFRARSPREESPFTRLAFCNDQWYGSAYWSGPNWTRVGRNWHHPGEETPSVRCFVAPCDGRATISGRVYKLHQDGDGIRAVLLHGDREVWQAEIDGADGEGVEPQVTLDLHRGDRVRFLIHKRGNIFCDTTQWDPVIRFEDGTAYQASTAFSANQGEGGWFYEMLDANPGRYLLFACTAGARISPSATLRSANERWCCPLATICHCLSSLTRLRIRDSRLPSIHGNAGTARRVCPGMVNCTLRSARRSLFQPQPRTSHPRLCRRHPW